MGVVESVQPPPPAFCRRVSLHTVCADECRSGHTLWGPVPMGTAVIANSLFLCFLAMLPLLECWQALGRSDMQKRCQVGLCAKRMFFLWLSPVCCVTHAELFGHPASVFFNLPLGEFIKCSSCFRAPSLPQADRPNLFLRVHNPQVVHEISFSQMTSG